MSGATMIDTLWRMSWQGAVLIGLVWLINATLGRWMSPAWRYGLWLIVAARLAMPMLPASPASLFNLAPGNEPAAMATEAGMAAEAGGGFGFVVSEEKAEDIANPQAAWDAWRVAMGCWALIALGLGAWMIAAHWRAMRRIRQEAEPAPRRATELLKEAAGRIGVRRMPELVVSRAAGVPSLTGVFRPVVLLPAGLIGELNDAELRFVLLHELAHLRRRDVAVQWIWMALGAMHWFNPLVWWAGWRVRVERELACDRRVIDSGGAEEAGDYGLALLRVIELCRPTVSAFAPRLGVPGVAMSTHRGALHRRIHMIASIRSHPSWISKLLGLAAAMTLAATGLTAAVERAPGTPVSPGAALVPEEIIVDKEDGTQAIMRVMRGMPIDFHFQQTPLNETLDYIADKAGVTIVPQWPRMEALGIGKDTQVTMKVHQPINAEAALRLVLEHVSTDEGVRLVYRYQDGLVVVTAMSSQPAETGVGGLGGGVLVGTIDLPVSNPPTPSPAAAPITGTLSRNGAGTLALAPQTAAAETRADQLLIQSQLLQLDDDAAAIVAGLNLPEGRPVVLEKAQADLIHKIMHDRLGVTILSAPRLTTRAGQMASIQVMGGQGQAEGATFWRKGFQARFQGMADEHEAITLRLAAGPAEQMTEAATVTSPAGSLIALDLGRRMGGVRTLMLINPSVAHP